MKRRTFLTLGAASLGLTVLHSPYCHLKAAAARRAPHILLRSSWQVVNIGDIAHSPGVMALIEKHIPEAETRLWASGDLSEPVAAMLKRRFPKLQIVKGSLNAAGKASTPALAEAVAWADFLLHGSGPSLVAARDVAAFIQHTGKPFGVYGITHGSFLSGNDQPLLDQAKFVFFRDSVSLQRARQEGVKCPIMEFGPDGAFACDVRNDAAAGEYLEASGLAEGKFLCCIPRLRYTPYWLIHPQRARDEKRVARNEAMKEHDHAPLREAITAVVREAGMKVLLCPEDMSQMAVGREMLLDRLPAAIQKSVVWRENFWLTDEAQSVYCRSAGLFGLEMHSPIMAIGNGIPAIVGRFAEQTSKGFMWRDIGLGEWLFDFDQEGEIPRYAPAVLALARDRHAAQARVVKARELVGQKQRETMAVLRKCLGI